jgi:hypothetical protein
MHYKVIFLILSSEDKDIYIEMKKLSKLYFNLFNDIKYFFLEYKPDIADEIIEIDNHLYLHGEESINPGMYNKTIKSMKYINNNYSYDYIIRTNLSTIWHMNNLYNLLNNLPKNNFAGGFIPQGFITGTGLIISKDVAQFLVNNQDNDIDIHEDVRISRIISQYVYLHCIMHYDWCFIVNKIKEYNLPCYCKHLTINDIATFSDWKKEDITLEEKQKFSSNDTNDYSNILHFRINNDDRTNDLVYYKIILNKLYNI